MADLEADIGAFRDYLPEPLLERLRSDAVPVSGVLGLRVAPGLLEEFPDLETPEALALCCDVYREVRGALREVLERRRADRRFIDAQTHACVEGNAGRAYLDADYETVIGRRDAEGRVVVGPLTHDDPAYRAARDESRPVSVPNFLAGPQVTLFGPADSEKMSINAMNALHRRLPHEPPRVAELVEASGAVPRWGADNEDSKTPVMRDFLRACRNLTGCFARTLAWAEGGKRYDLRPDGLAIPIKRIPGLAIPDGTHLVEGEPLPLHLYDFVLHLWHNWSLPEALVFYVPKLENEEEAQYLASLIEATERRVAAAHPSYVPGTVKLFIVFESPRSIFRIREIAHALYPWFVGGSLGWHDYLAATARMFRRDPRYRIPVKADPNIVIHHIRESHAILARSLRPIGGVSIGGMYGTLYQDGDPASFSVSIAGYVRDVVTQLRRGLDGFWVAHPDFVRIGIALVEAHRRSSATPSDTTLVALATDLVTDAAERRALLEFLARADIEGLPASDPRYLRGVLAADIEESTEVRNSDPAEVRYNVFQALQYLAAWLGGTGCVALPAVLTSARGEQVFVRIMDDLATTERSRWELWAEVQHGRVSEAAFEAILAEVVALLRSGAETQLERIQIPWEGESARWYPIAVHLLRQLVVSPEPVEAVSELLLPFTCPVVRDAADPWKAARALCPGKYS